MRFNVRHLTRFTYESPVTESVMEARMQPLTEARQRCLYFALTTMPEARVLMYQDQEGNTVHHFNVPARHSRMSITTEALVECDPREEVPETMGPGAWQALARIAEAGEVMDYLWPSPFTRSDGALDRFVAEIGLERGDDPLLTLRRLMHEMYTRLDYSPRSTRVDSPIDEALESRGGVCQDFAHIFMAAARGLGVPARYVSGYLYHDPDRADRSSDGATHAWVDVLLPDIGWVGFDPTNNLMAGERHVRVAVGRDYADVPPTRGVYKGASNVRSELAVSVRVGPAPSPLSGEHIPFTPWMSREATPPLRETDAEAQQQQ